MPAYDKRGYVPGKGASVWEYVKECSVQQPNKKNTHVCIYVGKYKEDGEDAIPRACGALVTCSRNGKTFVTSGAVNHMKTHPDSDIAKAEKLKKEGKAEKFVTAGAVNQMKTHPDSDIAKAEKLKKEGKAEKILEDVVMIADAGGAEVVPYSTTAAGRAEALTAMRTSSARFIINTYAAMSTLNSRYYRENLATHIKFTGGDPALAPITTRDNIKDYITADWNRTWSPALPFLASPPL